MGSFVCGTSPDNLDQVFRILPVLINSAIRAIESTSCRVGLLQNRMAVRAFFNFTSNSLDCTFNFLHLATNAAYSSQDFLVRVTTM
jgi:hypothetical protein